jgi:Flp pilus assembly protein TadG
VKRRHGTVRDLAKSEGGAVYVEFLIAFLPFLVFFMCLWQVSILYYAKLMVDHAAFSAARAAAVIVSEPPARVGDSGDTTVGQLTDARKSLVASSVYIALAPLIIDGTIGGDLTPEFPPGDTPGGANQTGTVTYAPMTGTTVANIRVRVKATFICRIAFANVILCGSGLSALGLGSFVPPNLPIVSEAVFPYQGASYAYQSGS